MMLKCDEIVSVLICRSVGTIFVCKEPKVIYVARSSHLWIVYWFTLHCRTLIHASTTARSATVATNLLLFYGEFVIIGDLLAPLNISCSEDNDVLCFATIAIVCVDNLCVCIWLTAFTNAIPPVRVASTMTSFQV